MKRLVLAMIGALCAVACSAPEDREACAEGGPEFVEVDVDPSTHGTVYPEGNATVTGTAQADIRIDRLLVGGLNAKGIGENFATWSIELTPAQLSQHAGLAMLEVQAIDVCGVTHDAEPVAVLVKAPAGTPATGLTVLATPLKLDSAGEPECYLPADGSHEARLTVVANEAAAGVTVELSSATEGEFLGAPEKKVILDRRDGLVCDALEDASAPATCAAHTTAVFRPTKAGRVRIAAAGGATFDLDDSGLRAAGPPDFTGTSSAIAPQTTVQIHVETDGRLKSCIAITDRPGLVSATVDGSDFTTSAAEFDDPSCGQRETFDVQFLEGAPVGLSLEIRCEDSYDQSSVFKLLAGPAPEADTGG